VDSNRYNTWLAVWEWFQAVPRNKELEALYELLNRLWQEDRSKASPEARAAYAWARSKFLGTKQ
jgi:hypothetical protein